MENIKQHTFTLTQYTYTALLSLRYPNGAPVVRIYSDSEFSSPEVQGPIINFNVLDDKGNVIGYSQVGFLCTVLTCSQENCSCLELCSLSNPEVCGQGLWTFAVAVAKATCGGRGHWPFPRDS